MRGKKRKRKEKKRVANEPSTMKIASFNIQRFGLAKISNPSVLSTLVKIVSRYDIMVILEVVDISGASVDCFLEELNRVNKNHHYSLKISSRLGRTRYKEQFLFLYRDDLVNLVGSYQYEDNQVGDEDVFAREPYILHFRSVTTVLKDLVLIPVHTKPDDTKKELDELYEVFLAVKRRWRTDNIMILGDFNADGAYVSKKDMRDIRIRSDKNFHWLIGDDVDTTANTRNDHTYDRIVVYGDDMLDAVVPNSAQPFNFQKAFGLTYEMALDVSDHYPVEVELKRSAEDQPSEVPGPGSKDPLPTKTQTEELYKDVLELKKKSQLLKQDKLKLQIQMLQLQLARQNE
ncbi:hypothetical protein AAFF_G00298920 [Aldrovandia affinis]|uniref:Endonuclease/exonuclease/phosphatase domain-containing protein n=1 Tax=Aldrovandia affinis TaxID=143900 RepID=A0AAD7W1A3_9TELE|nr:hypothetical protein AAFF_G00298920 [Aldrovandia affinis]